MQLEILGSGTSHGIPVIACDCAVCASTDPRDNRLRASALLRDETRSILIDAGPEFRLQALRSRITRLDAVLLTHSHADHVHGVDDLRIFSHERDMPVYANSTCVEDLKVRFDYVFKETQLGGGKPKLRLIEVRGGETIEVAGVRITAIPLLHGAIPILGWRCGDTSYLTDCNGIPDAAWPILAGTKKLVIGALRARPHSTHFSFSQAVEAIGRIGCDEAWLTHLCHDFTHEGIRAWLAGNAPGKKIEPAFDGLRITIG